MHALLKKKFSQNFLIDRNIVKKIVHLLPNKKLNILEIGPGDGRLTDEILAHSPLHLTLVEIDKDLVMGLNLKYQKFNQVKIINEDILKYKIIRNYEVAISNLPYNISSQILVKITVLDNSPEKMIFMFQKEFAQRLLETKLNSLNSLVNCFYEINFNFNVGNKFDLSMRIEDLELKNLIKIFRAINV